MSKPISAAMRIAERVAAGNFTDQIDVGGATNSAAC